MNFAARWKGGETGGKTSAADHIKNGTGMMNFDARSRGGSNAGVAARPFL